MSELVTRYSKPPFNIKYWEIGNEPDIDPSLIAPTEPFGCWGDQNDEFYGQREKATQGLKFWCATCSVLCFIETANKLIENAL